MSPEQHAKLYPGAGQMEADLMEYLRTTIDPQNPNRAAYILKIALKMLVKNAELRDSPDGERSAPRAAAILTAWTGREWTATDVWRALFAVKMAREIQGAPHLDDYVDLSAYAALLGEDLVR